MCLTDSELRGYLSGQLSISRASEVEAHFAGCDACALRLSTLPDEGELPDATRDDEPPEPSLDRALPKSGARIGRFLLTEELEGTADFARYRADGAEVRVFVGAPSAARLRVLRAAERRSSLEHPNLRKVLEVGVAEERAFMALEPVEGTPLPAWLEGARSEKEVLDLFVALGRGLAALHEAGFVEAGVELGDLFAGTRPRLGVEGLWRFARGQGSSVQVDSALAAVSGPLAERLTRQAEVSPTLHLAPEHFAGRVADPAADQFAFCSALYTALWKRRPFDPDRLAADAVRQMEALDPELQEQVTLRVSGVRLVHAPPKKSELSEPARDAIMRGLELEPAERFPSMAALLKELTSKTPRFWRRR